MAPSMFLLRLPGIGACGLLFLAGCAPHPSAAPAPPLSSPLKISLQLTPPKPQQLDPTLFKVQVRDRSGKPISSAIVTVNLAMPTMDMGRNAVLMNAGEPGQYRGIGRFTMAGSWGVTVTATKGKDRATQIFPVEVQ